MTYRNDLDALTARQTALETEVRDRTHELDQARRLVEEINARARLPVLDNLRVAAPCGASWDAMTGDARVRACGDCQKNVYNLSDMTRDEAEALIREKEGRLCVRYFQRADGTILLKDCGVGVKRRRRRRLAAVGAAVGLAGAALAVEARRLRVDQRMIMGDVSPVREHATAGALAMPPPSVAPPPTHRVTMGLVAPTQEIKGEISAPPPAHSHHEPRK